MEVTSNIIMVINTINVRELLVAFLFFIHKILYSNICSSIFFQIQSYVWWTLVVLFDSFAKNSNVSSFLLSLPRCYWSLVWYYVYFFLLFFISLFILLVCWKYSYFVILGCLFLKMILIRLLIFFIWLMICFNLNNSWVAIMKHILISCLDNVICILFLKIVLCILKLISLYFIVCEFKNQRHFVLLLIIIHLYYLVFECIITLTILMNKLMRLI